MIENLQSYFEPEQQFYLNTINYKRIDTSFMPNTLLDCSDKLDVTPTDNGLLLNISRTVSFSPDSLFCLNITYGVILTYIDDKKQELNIDSINWVDEFTSNGGFALGNILGHISLLISQITSSFGQTPLITPPSLSITNYNNIPHAPA